MSHRYYSKNRSLMSRRRSAFTLLEVLLVLAILVVVGSFAVTQFMNIFENSKIDSTKTAISEATKTVKVYQMQQSQLPVGLDDLVTNNGNVQDASRWRQYLDKAPVDAWSHPLNYEIIDQQAGTFRIWSSGPNGTSNDEDDVIVQ